MITTLTGDNRFLISQDLRDRLAKFIAEHGDLTVEQLDGEEADYQTIYDSLTNLPFLASKKLTVLRNGSANKDFAQAADNLMAELSETNELILVETKLDKRSSFYKLLKTKTDYRELNDLDGRALADWLVEQAEQIGGKLSIANANLLIDLAGTSQLRLSNELAKLISYNPEIDQAAIRLLVEPTPQSTIFQLLDAVFGANTEKAIDIYDNQRLQRVEPQQVIAMLAWQVHILTLVKSAKTRSPSEIAKQARLNPFVVNKSLAITRKLSADKIKSIVKQLAQLDVKLKTQTIDADDAIKQFILEVAEA